MPNLALGIALINLEEKTVYAYKGGNGYFNRHRNGARKVPLCKIQLFPDVETEIRSFGLAAPQGQIEEAAIVAYLRRMYTR